MARFRHEDPYYPAIITNGWIEEELEEDHEENSKEDPEEYQELDYEDEDFDEGSNIEEVSREIVNEPYPIRSRHEPFPPSFFQDAPP